MARIGAMSLAPTCLYIAIGLAIAWAILKELQFFDDVNR
jgi:uncharacterized membrane protein YuzA (DUF378 family)